MLLFGSKYLTLPPRQVSALVIDHPHHLASTLILSCKSQVETLLSNNQIRLYSLTNLFYTHHSPRLISYTMDEEYDVR